MTAMLRADCFRPFSWAIEYGFAERRKWFLRNPILIWSGGAHGVGAATMHAEIDWAIQYDFYMSNGGCESAVVSIKVMP